MDQSIKLDNELRFELIDLLSEHPALATREGRDVWLYNLPSNVQDMITRRSDYCEHDLAHIIEAIKLIQLTDDQWPILILIDALLSMMGNTKSRANLRALREKMIVRVSPTENQEDITTDTPTRIDTELVGNPFISRMPVRSKFFFGRDALIKKIFQYIKAGQSISLVGEQRSGKTSILLRLRDIKNHSFAQPGQHTFVFLDFSGLDYHSVTDVWITLLHALASELVHTDAESIVRDTIQQLRLGEPISIALPELFRTLTYRDVKVTFLLDEFESTAHAKAIADPSLYKIMRNLAVDAETELTYVIATRQALSKVETSVEKRFDPLSSPFFNIFQQLSIPLFRTQEAAQMVKELLRDAGASIRTIRAFWSQRDFLFDMSGFHPFFLQLACYHLFEYGMLPDGTFSEQIPYYEVELDFFEEALAHFDYYWHTSSENERSLMRQLATGSTSASTPFYDFTLNRLRNRCLVAKVDKSRWQLFSVVFAKWIQSQTDDSLESRVLRMVYQTHENQPGSVIGSESIRNKLELTRQQMKDVIQSLEQKACITARFVGDRALLEITADGEALLKS